MTEKYITYRWNGRTFDVPESQSAEMEKNYPDATIEMRMGDRSFDVPLAHKQEALDKYGSDISFLFDREPEAKPEPKHEPKYETTPVETEEQQPSFAPAEDDSRASRRAQRRERWNDRLVAANDSLARAQHGLAKTNAEAGMEAVTEAPKGEKPSWGESFIKGAGAGFTRAGKGLYDALIILSSNNTYIDPLTGELVKTPDYDTLMREKSEPMVQESLKAGEVADRLSKEADPTGGEKGFVDLIAEGKIGTALQKGLATGAESLPMTLSAYSPYTMALNMVSMAGANYAEQTLDNPEVDKWKRATQAIGSAALEQAVEKFADPIFKYIGGGGGTGEFTESIAREILEDGTREAIESISKRILNVLKGTAKDALGEGAEEVITSFGNDALGEALDLIDGDKDYGIRAQWEQMKEENPDAKLKDFATDKAKEYMDAFIGGALSGAYMSGTTQSIGEAVSASNDRNARNAMTSSYETGASMDYGDMYDTDTDVNDAVGEVASSFVDENGDSAISNEFIESLSAEDAFTLSRREEISPEQRKSLGALALAKARQEGLNQKLDERLESNVAEIRARIADAAENGQVVSGMYNGNVVYVKGGVVNNGSVALTADGVNGPVVVVDSVTGEKITVNSNEINSASVLDAETLGNDIEAYLRDSENKNREAARNTMSLRAKTKAVQQFAGRKIMVDLGNGLTEVEVQRVNPKSGTVVIKGKKGDLGGQSIVEMRADVIYDSIYRDDDGNPVFPETQQPDAPQVQPEEAPQAEAPQVQPELTGDEDFRDFTGTIVVNGVPVNVDEVTSQDNTADRITYTYTDENGNRRTASTTVGGFASAVQQAAAQNAPVVPEAAPAGEVAVESPAPTAAESPEPTAPETAPTEAAPLTPEGIDWDALFEQDKEAYFAEVQKQFGDEALDVLNEEIQAAQQALDALAKAKTNSQNERLENRKKKAALQGKIDALNGMIARLTAAPTAPAVPEAAPVGEQPAPTEPVTPAPEAPSVPQEPAPVSPAEGTLPTATEPTTPTGQKGEAPAEGGYIIEDGKIINPTVIEMPSESGNKNRIYIAEKDGKWGYGFHAITDDGNESWNDTIQLELLRYDSKEDAIKGALSYLNTYKGIKKDSPSTGIDAFIQYVNDTYFPTEPAPTAPETPSGAAPTTNVPAAPAPKQPAATPVSKGGALARLISAAKAKAAKIAAKAGMKDFVGTDKLKPALTGIYRSGGYEYASDGHVLAKVKAQYPAEQEGKIYSPKTGQEINGTFPKSDLIIDEALKRPEVDVDLDQIIAYAQALEDIKKGLNKNALLYVKIGNNHFKSDVLLTVAKMAKKHGLTKAHLDESGKFAMAFTGENGTVLVMPVNPSTIGDSTRILDASTGSITFSSYSTFIKTPTTLKGIEAARESLEAILPNIGEDYIENAKDGGWLKLVDGKVMFMFDASEIANAKIKANDPNTFKALEDIERDGLEIPLSASEIAKLFPEVAAPTAPDASNVPAVAPNPVENPIAEAGKKERQLATNLKKVGLSPEQKQDLAFNAGKAIADMFATREEYDAYAETATDFGAYNADFEKGVDASFASRQQNAGNSPVNSVPLENEPNGDKNGEQGEAAGNGQGTGNTGGGTGNTGNQAGNQGDKEGEPKQGKGGRKGGKKSGQIEKYPARKGNATQKLLVDTFGFASVKIPNSRKETLNAIYDFMMEMAKVLGISPKSIGNGGWITVDSLRGNSSASARHILTSMVVDQTVVASTLQYKYAKLMGIAHEWWHALDHVLAFFNTGKGKVVASELPKSKFTGREETYDAVQQVIQAIKDSGHADRMRSLNVPMRYKLYLLENSEMAARAFDEYIRMKFAEAGISIVGTADTLEMIQPTKEEMAVIAPALDNLFNVLQEKEGKTPGTSVLYNIGEEMEPQSDAKKLATEAILTALDDGNRDVEILSDEQAEQYLKMIGADPETQFSIDTDKPIFLSNAAIAVQGIKQEKATPEQWLKMIEKAGGLKAGEDKWMGLSDWLKASDKKTLTKQEVLDFINENTIRIEEVNYKQWDALDYIDEAVKILEAEMREIGWDAMVEKYPRFDELFEEYNGELMWSETRASVAEYEQFIFDEHNLLERPINDTREKYTTDGLDNKKEIAIIVPTIEPWSKSDVIHFGDAGDGRAVAWVRFGEARAYSKEYSDFYDFQKKMQQKYYSDRVIAALSDSDLEALTAEEREEFMRLRDIARSVPFGKRTNRRVLVIDEIQSKRHQDAREQGGYRNDAKIAELKAKENALLDEKVELTKEILHKFGVIHYIETGTPGKFDPELQEKAEKGQIGSQEQMARMKELDAEIYATFNERHTLANGIPDAPFDKNWSELAMKRMLRYAAENGYDAVAWTGGDQQAERYDIGGAVDSIYYAGSFKEGVKDIDINLDTRRGGNIHLQVDNNGEVINEYNDFGDVKDSPYIGKNLSEILGKELADKALSLEEEQSLSGEGLRVGGEGMKGFYDKMLPAFMNKYGKKWGVKVSDITLPHVEEAGRVMHSVPVNDAMRESVMEGQPMFYKTPNGTVYGWTDGKKIYLTKAGLNPNTPIHEYTHLWAKAMMLRNPKGWDSIKNLLKGTPIWNEVINDPNYSNIRNDEDAVASEALSRISGSENAAKMEQMAQKMIDEAKGTGRKLEARGLIQNMRDALNKFWEFVWKDLFKMTNFRSVEHVTDRVLFDLLNNTDLGTLSEGQVEAQIVTDPKVIAELEASQKRTGYRNVVQNEDGTFSSPMAFWLQGTKTRGGAKSRVETAKFELGKWEEAEEHPELVDDNGHVVLVKPDKSTVEVAYDPYIHNRLDPVNLQFKAAWNRPELVYVKTEVAETDLNSGYHADGALLPVGVSSWSNGDLMLSKYDKPVGVMSWEEVADAWVERLNGEGVHFDVVPPALRQPLVERGVEILPPHKGMGKDCNDAYKAWKNDSDSDALLFRKKMIKDFSDMTDEELYDFLDEYEGQYSSYSTDGNAYHNYLKEPNKDIIDAIKKSIISNEIDEVGSSVVFVGDYAYLVDHLKPSELSKDSNGIGIIRKVNISGVEKSEKDLLKESIHAGRIRNRRDVNQWVSVYRAKRELYNRYFGSAEDAEAALVDGRLDWKELGEKLLSRNEGSVEKGGLSTEIGKEIPTNSADIQNAAVDYLAGTQRNEVIQRAVNEEAAKLNVSVTYATREQMPKGHQNDKGYYDTKTGEIVICTENASSIADAIQTILHEAVAHKGLRQLMGDKFNEFINRVYDSLDAETKAKVDKLAAEQYNGNTAVAMEEYMASLAESEDFSKNSILDKIKSIFEDIINAILGRNDIKIGDNELRYILRASYNNMVNPRNMDSIRGWAQDQMMREDYKINHVAPEILSRTGIDPTEIAAETAGMVYDRVVRSNWQEFQRQFQDAMQPVRIAIDAIQQATGNVPIEDYENYLFAQNQASSRSRVEIDDFARRYYSPIIEQVNKIIDTILEARGYDKSDRVKRAEAYKELRNYLIAKHGLERNEYYQTHKTRRMTAKEMRPELDQAKKDYDDKVNQINADTSLTDAERQLQLRDALDEYNAVVQDIQTREVPDIRDYSGLTSLFATEDLDEAEQRAQEAVDNFENAISTDELWAKINAATDKTLRHSYESGLLSRQQYEDIKAMFEFYIPLRGFDETTAEDVYAYARFEGNRFNPAVHKAEGRTSLADDPIAIIMNMAESEIAQGNKNRAKQALYNFLLNRPVMGPDGKQHQNSLMQIEDVWYIETVDASGNTVYMIATPDHAAGESWEDFENRMQTLAASDKAFKSKKGKMDITMRFQKQANRDAHYVYLKVNGVEKAIYINGNPKAADAVNGSYRPESKWGEDKLRTINRLISSAFTNYSLEFTARNYFRDMVYSHINMGVRESDPAYRKKFRQNWRHNNMRSVMRMLNAYRAGEYDGAALNEDEAAFVEFMNNGGQTGYTVINSVENHKKELERAIERMQKGIVKGGIKNSTIFRYTLGGIELLNEVSELVTRFAAFKTSRDMGRGVNRAINDAKEITVNFNTKGAQDGKGWMGAVSRYFGWSKFFFNASVQGVQNIKAMAQANKLKFCTTVGGIAGLGFCMPIIVGALAEIFGGDDDDENFYWNIPEYDRQNNLCIPVGSRYAKIPLPIGFREVYAIGDMVAAMAFDKKFERDVEQIGMDIANKIAAVVLPINPLESSANGLSIWHTALYTALPSSLQFPIQNATNIDWKGAPLQKEYTYNENDPQWMKAYASNPDWMTGLSKWCNEHINLDGDFDGMDWSPEKLDNTLSNMFGGVYTLIKKTGKTISMAWDEEERNLSNIPLAGVILGSRINDDERFLTDAYYDMKEYYDRNESRIKRTAKAFGLSLDEVFVEQKGTHQPKMQEIYGNDNFDFMQEWYKGNKELESLKGKIDRREKKLAETDEPSQELIDEIAALSNEYDTKRREFVNDMLELD